MYFSKVFCYWGSKAAALACGAWLLLPEGEMLTDMIVRLFVFEYVDSLILITGQFQKL